MPRGQAKRRDKPAASVGALGAAVDRSRTRERREHLRVLEAAVFDGWDIPRSAYETVPRDLLDIASDTSASARDRIRAAEALSRLLAQRIDAALHLDRTQRLDSNSATERVEILNEITDEQLRAVAASIVLPVRLPQVSE